MRGVDSSDRSEQSGKLLQGKSSPPPSLTSLPETIMMHRGASSTALVLLGHCCPMSLKDDKISFEMALSLFERY